MQVGDIVFTYDNSLLSKLIRYFDGHGKFSHCTIMVSENEMLEAQYLKKSAIVPFYIENYEVISLGLSDEQKSKIQDLAPKLVGVNYDYIQVFSYLLRDIFKHFRIVNSPRNFICSEIVEILLQDVKAIPLDKHFIDMSPNELYKYLTSIIKK
jgi:cell wall-associated NlpC family hydrolase